MNNGFITLHRKFTETSFYKDSTAKSIALHLLLTANHKAHKLIFCGKEITVERGQLITGRLALSKQLNIPAATVYRKLMLLQNLQFLSIETNNSFSIITICKYNSYQNQKEHDEQQSEQRVSSERAAREHKQQCNNNNNINIGDILADVPTTVSNEPPKPPVVKRAETAQGRIMTSFMAKYKEWTGQSYDDRSEDYIILAGLIKKHGEDAVKHKIVLYAKICRDASEWFTKDGLKSFTINKFKHHWNEIFSKDEDEVAV